MYALVHTPCSIVLSSLLFFFFLFFFFNDTATTDIYTLSLHDALPIFNGSIAAVVVFLVWVYLQAVILLYGVEFTAAYAQDQDRKSTRLNSSHRCISYAVFCLKKKKNK